MNRSNSDEGTGMSIDTSRFLKVYSDILLADGYIGVDGSKTELSIYDILVYSILWDRHKFFTSLGRPHYDTYEQLSALIPVSERTIRRSINTFRDNGVIETSSKGRNNTYRKVHPLILYGERMSRQKDRANAHTSLIDSSVQDIQTMDARMAMDVDVPF